MKLSHKLLAILLSGIVIFSSVDFSVLAAKNGGESTVNTSTDNTTASETVESGEDTGSSEEDAEDSGEDVEGNSEAEVPEIPVDSNAVDGWPQGPQVNAESAIVMEVQTGTVLYAKNIDAAQYPASITKIMTVLLALENSSLDETVTFSDTAVFSIERGSSHIARTTGEELTMEQCLYAIMLESANECANAVAEHIAGSIEAFADMMNERAAQLGCTNTHFVNPHGLHDDNHYTSAHDMVLITQAALQYDTFREIAGTIRYTIPPTNKNDEALTMNNHHSMMSAYKTSKYLDSTVFAGKTGFTTDALNTLVTCAHRSEMDVICVLLRAPSGTTYQDTATLLDYVSDNFSPATLPEEYSSLPDSVTSQIQAQIGSSCDFSAAVSENGSCVYAAIPDGLTLADLSSQVNVQSTDTSSAEVSVTWYYGDDVPVANQTFQIPLTQTSAVKAESSASASSSENADKITDENKDSVDTRKDISRKNPLSGKLKWGFLILTALILVGISVGGLLLLRAKRERERQRRRRARRKERNMRRFRQEIDNMMDDTDTLSDL